jgi:hypothetical protein
MNKWWGYIHTDSSIHAKRYFDEKDLSEAVESDFVDRICPVFKAETSVEAFKHVRDFFFVMLDKPEGGKE